MHLPAISYPGFRNPLEDHLGEKSLSPTLQSTPGPSAIRPSGPVSTSMPPLSHIGVLATWAHPPHFLEIKSYYSLFLPPTLKFQKHWWKVVTAWILFGSALSEVLDKGELESVLL